jgi:hypothetical protein
MERNARTLRQSDTPPPSNGIAQGNGGDGDGDNYGPSTDGDV